MIPSPGIETGPHWWKATALTTAPSLLPLKSSRFVNVYYSGAGNQDGNGLQLEHILLSFLISTF